MYYGASRHDASEFGLDYSFLYKEITKKIEDDTKKILFKQVGNKTALKAFEAWASCQDKKYVNGSETTEMGEIPGINSF